MTFSGNVMGLWSVVLLGTCSCCFTGMPPAVDTGMQVTGEPAGGLQLTVKSAKYAYEPGEAIALQITINNIKNTNFVCRQNNPLGLYTISLVLPNGKNAPLTALGQDYRMSAPFVSYFLIIKPQQSYTKPVIINRLFDMTLPGKYKIEVSKETADEKGKRITLSAPPITIRVKE